MGNAKEQEKKRVDLGLEKLQPFLQPGEIFLTNAGNRKLRGDFDNMTAHEVVSLVKRNWQVFFGENNPPSL
ncbi:TPA: hypothetical protein DIV55_01770 [Patescibacteria group bacterium]|uniref:Uncharacterized protein n=1 Tax=Candidatus Gottesmanbacteria bacterium GW2011_GWA1_43_11 TaxID=1618436 RepID=A0A0G1ENQ5_9BACT|nr:MAG: hypothetical protein UV59_C0016G0034 [Candidatus Gottesmanbacteria bacterium GW2011_GWA1_43_11]HCS78450.1 hypothetical protein [Patescibacteria group bacterium]